MILIGLNGLAFSGKSTVALRLIHEHGFYRVKFAGPLKAMLRALLHVRGVSAVDIDRMIEGDLKEVPTSFLEGRTPREAMITLGTEWGRDLIGSNLWINSTRDEIDSVLRHGCDRIVIDDVRFPNEADMIRSLGGRVVNILGGLSKPGTSTHESETHKIVPDHRIINSSSLARLNEIIDSMAREFGA